MADAPAVRTTCPYCGVGCGILATRGTDGAVEIKGDPEHPANFGRLCSKGSALARNAVARWTAAPPDRRRSGDQLGRGARSRRRPLRRGHPRARTGLRRVLCLGPVPDRGLLRRQQADEGLHRLGQHRHQFAALHGVVRRRAQARLRHRHRARCLCRPRRDRSRRPGRLEPGLVPPDPLPARPRRAGEARHEDRRHRSAPHGDGGASPTCIFRSRPTPTWRSSMALFAHLAESGAADRKFVARHTTGFEAALAAAGDGDPATVAAATGLEAADVERFFAAVCGDEARAHALLAGRQPVGLGHRQGQRHHQLPSRHRAHRPAGHGAVLADRPAQRDGRTRGRRARQSARRAYGHRRSGPSRARRQVLAHAAAGEARRA